MVTARRIPVPEPIAPIKSAVTERAPIQRPPKSRGRGDVSVQLVDHRGLSVASHHHLLFPQLLSNILGRAARDINPGFAEEGAGAEHEGDVEDRMDRVCENTCKGVRW